MTTEDAAAKLADLKTRLANLETRFDALAERWLAGLTVADRARVRSALPETKRAYFDLGRTADWLDSGAIVRVDVRRVLSEESCAQFDAMVEALMELTVTSGVLSFAVGYLATR